MFCLCGFFVLPLANIGQKRSLDPLALGLQTIDSHHVCAGDQPGSSRRAPVLLTFELLLLFVLKPESLLCSPG